MVDLYSQKLRRRRHNHGLTSETNKTVFNPNEMKKYLVIGNPVQHSLSPKLHNYWFNQNNIEGVYEKKLTENNISDVIKDIRNSKIEGVNVTVPFKKSVIPFIDHMEHYATKPNR